MAYQWDDTEGGGDKPAEETQKSGKQGQKVDGGDQKPAVQPGYTWDDPALSGDRDADAPKSRDQGDQSHIERKAQEQRDFQGHAASMAMQGDEMLKTVGVLAGAAAQAVTQINEQAKQEERRKKEAENKILLSMMQDSPFDPIFAGLSDDDIGSIEKDIINKTGKSLEENARELLGEEAAERRPGETEKEYKRRIVKSLAEEVMETPDQVKPEYAGHAVADAITGNEKYQQQAAKVAAENARNPKGAAVTTSDIERVNEELIQPGYGAANQARTGLENETLVEVSKGGQETHRDAGLAAGDNMADLAAILGETPMKQASAQARAEFNECASCTEPQPVPENISQIDLAAGARPVDPMQPA